MSKRLYIVERVHQFVVMASDDAVAAKLVEGLHCDDLSFRGLTFTRQPREIVSSAIGVPPELMNHPPFSDGVCDECGDTEDGDTVAEILKTRTYHGCRANL